MLKGVTILKVGEAKGHGIYFDEIALKEIYDLCIEKTELKVRFGHPTQLQDAIGTEIGRAFNFDLVDNQKIIADVEFIETSMNSDMIDHVTKIAEVNPDFIGLSIEFIAEEYVFRDGHAVPVPKELIGVAFVSEPAATDGIFNSKKTLNQFDLIIDSLKKINKKMNLFNKKKKSKVQLAEIVTTDGVVVLIPGDVPKIGDSVQVIMDGEAMPAPAGEYEFDDYIIVVDENSFIAEIKEVPESSDTEPQDGEVEALKKEVEQLRNQLKIAKLNTRPAGTPVQTQMTFAYNKHNPSKIERAVDKWKYQLSTLWQYKSDVRNKGYSDLPVRKGARRHNLAVGTAFDPSTLTVCAPYFAEILKDFIVIDNILDFATRISAPPPPTTPASFEIKIPRLPFDTTLPDQQLLKQGDDDCGFTPWGEMESSQRILRAYNLFLHHEECIKDYKGLFDGNLYIDEETVPAEVMLIDYLAEKIFEDLERIFWFGRGAIDGILQVICNEITSGCIPATQVKPFVAINDTNAIAQIELLASLMPAAWISNPDNVLVTEPQVKRDYYLNARALYNTSLTEGITSDYIRRNEPINFISGVLRWAAQWWNLQAGTAPIGTTPMFITQPDNLVYLWDAATGDRELEVWYERTPQLLRFRWNTYFGVNVRDCRRVVASINC